MYRLGFLSKNLIFCIVAGLLVLQWVGATHTHDSDIDIDRVCSICLTEENLSHGLASSKFTFNLNGVFAKQDSPFTVQYSQSSVSHYRSRAPPLYL